MSNRVSRRQGQRWAEQDQQQYADAPPPAAAAPPATPDPLERLKELGELHDSGVLTDDEFAAQKAKVLGS